MCDDDMKHVCLYWIGLPLFFGVFLLSVISLIIH